MTGALRYEWLRLTTVRSTFWLSVLSAVLTGLLAVARSSDPARDVSIWIETLSIGAAFTPALMALIGIFALGHEYRYGTIRATLTALPQRSAVMAAKVLVTAAWALVVGVIVEVVAYGVAVIRLGDAGFSLSTGPSGRVLLGLLVYIVLWSLVGLALGGLFRNVPAAVSTVLVVPLIAEPLILGLLTTRLLEPISGVGRFLPFSAGQRLLSTDDGSLFSSAAERPLSPWQGGLTFAVFMAVLTAACWLLFERRDA